ncbi:hypothetical protein GTY65_30780 [Streptomyces sp. SID8379]|uniref:hypothetical protein n=1 Tax=unclassified Streptomyces TaxID=2593676 RepID=UPI00037F8CB7|nr:MULTISPECIES: hypothetical protein [unclassified Streptomyces]MYW68427.1 hypothetical protein [Streptomyces sp. SID8379]
MAALVTAPVAALALLLLGAPQALAGGPTSALVVSPESKESRALYFTDKEYGELSEQLGDTAPGQSELPPGLSVGAGRQLSVTWLIHDIQEWRVDRVYPDTPKSKEVWIHTATDLPKTEGYWHRARHPDQLRTLLHKLGVMGRTSPGGAAPVYPAPAAAGSVTDGSAVPARDHDGVDWWWAIPGLVAGAALALLVRPLVARVPRAVASMRLRHREPGPRQELRDL